MPHSLQPQLWLFLVLRTLSFQPDFTWETGPPASLDGQGNTLVRPRWSHAANPAPLHYWCQLCPHCTDEKQRLGPGRACLSSRHCGSKSWASRVLAQARSQAGLIPPSFPRLPRERRLEGLAGQGLLSSRAFAVATVAVTWLLQRPSTAGVRELDPTERSFFSPGPQGGR